MPEADIIIAWGHGAVPDSVKGSFQRPTRFLTLPNPNWKSPLEGVGSVRGILQKYASDVKPLRVSVLGFSASCQGVAAVLGAPDGGFVDAAVAIDGIHTGLPVTQAAMTPWFNFAKLAVVNERLFVISHSSVVPPGYASTTQTAEWLWNTITMEPTQFTVPPMPDLSVPPTSVHVNAGPSTGKDRTIEYPAPAWKGKRRAGGLVVLGLNNLDGPGTADHIYQAKAMLPMVLTRFLAKRWNEMDPHAMGQACFVGAPARVYSFHPVDMFLPVRRAA